MEAGICNMPMSEVRCNLSTATKCIFSWCKDW